MTHKVNVLREGAVGPCPYCGVPIRLEQQIHKRHRKRIIVLERKVLRSGMVGKRARWVRHRCPEAPRG